MSSSLSLHNELVASIVRGFQRFQEIEFLRSLSDAVLLEARMTIAASDDDCNADKRAPSLHEIEAARDAINATWDDEERECRRKGYARSSVVVDQRQREHKRKYRDKINARRRALRADNPDRTAQENARRLLKRRMKMAASAA